MKKKIFIILLCPVFFISITTLLGQDNVLTINKKPDANFQYSISSYLDVLPDCNSEYSFVEVQQKSVQHLFVTNNNQWLTSDCKIHWLKLVVNNTLPYDIEALTYIQGSFVTLYEPNDSLGYVSKKSGLLLPISKRDQGDNFGHYPYISILIKKGGAHVYYWRVDTNDKPVISPHTNLDATLVSYSRAITTQRSYMFSFIFTCSILIGLSFYHIIIFIITRERLYLYFALFSMFSGLYASYFKGYLLEIFFAEEPEIHYQYVCLIANAGFYLTMWLFITKYLSLRTWVPIWNHMLTATFLIAISLALSTNLHQNNSMQAYALISVMIVLVMLGVVLYFKRHPLAVNYLLGFAIMTTGLIANSIFSILGLNQGIWDLGDLGLLTLQILLAVGLANRIRTLNKESVSFQTQLIVQLKENQIIQQKLNAELEVMVKDRTQEVETKNEKLTKLILLKDKLFTILTHDIRAPFNHLSAFLTLLESQTLTEETIKKLVPKIKENLEYNQAFINDLFAWAKNHMQDERPTPTHVDLYALTAETINLLKPASQEKSITVQNHVTESTFAYADQEMVKTIVRNLLANAIKFTNHNGNILFTSQIDNNLVHLKITDNGIGMNQDQLSKLFSSEVYSTRGTANERGTGLGLIICKEFAEKNGGSLQVESIEGGGSTFTLSIPVANALTK